VRPSSFLPRATLLALLAACAPEQPDVVAGTGTVEIVEVDVAALVPARVLRVWRNEGDVVRPGDTLVSLTQSATVADVDARRARLAAAEAQLRDLLAGATRPEIDRAEAELRAADAEATRTTQDLQRLVALESTGGVTQQQVDAARAASALAAARRDGARDALAVVRQGARADRVTAARAEVSNARAALAASEQAANDLVLTASVHGVVLLRNAEPGEALGAGVPAMTIGEVSRPFVRIYVNQQALPRVQLGAQASAVLDGAPERAFPGRVVAISPRAEFTPRVALTEEERADMLFGVKIELADTTGMLKPGLSVTVQLTTRDPGT
jgi:HlyD family secretion protein